MQLKLTDVSLSFGDRALLREIDLAVGIGESVSIVGPSGSGKSTLLALSGGLLAPDRGRVAVEGADGTGHSPRDSTAFILQTNTVLPHRTAAENVALGGVRLGASWRRLVDEAVRLVEEMGMASRAHAPATKLSGGEIQRVVIARAIISQAPFLLADEPTGQLDAVASQVVTRLLVSRATRAGVIIVTHDQEVARQCGRQLVLHDGVLEPA